MIHVAGVDGCPGGGSSSFARSIGRVKRAYRSPPRSRRYLAITPPLSIIAVDIPVGLPERGGVGGRAADVEARSRLGNRQSSVFAVPARAAVMELEYRAACATALAHSDPRRMVSKQTFNLFSKIREVDALMSPVLQARVVECHPELSFWALNGERPLEEPKKVKSRPYEPGLALRRGLLTAAGYDPALLLQVAPLKPVRGGADDLLDAAACSWIAARIAGGLARRFPTDPPRDATGLRLEIWG